MRNLIKADMQRILRKKSIWLAFIFMIAIVAAAVSMFTAKSIKKSKAE